MRGIVTFVIAVALLVVPILTAWCIQTQAIRDYMEGKTTWRTRWFLG